MTLMQKTLFWTAAVVGLAAFVAMRDFTRSEALVSLVLAGSLALIGYLAGTERRSS